MRPCVCLGWVVKCRWLDYEHPGYCYRLLTPMLCSFATYHPSIHNLKMVKREYQEMEDVDANEYSPSAKTSIKTESQAYNESISSAEIIVTPTKKSRSMKGREGGSNTPKSKSPPKSVNPLLCCLKESCLKELVLMRSDGRLPKMMFS